MGTDSSDYPSMIPTPSHTWNPPEQVRPRGLTGSRDHPTAPSIPSSADGKGVKWAVHSHPFRTNYLEQNGIYDFPVAMKSPH